MVSFMNEPTTVAKEEEQERRNQASKFESLKESVQHFDSNLSDLSFDDSFIDFDSIREFFQGSPERDNVSLLEKVDFCGLENCIVEMADKDSSFEASPVVDRSNLSFEASEHIEVQSGGSVVADEEKVESGTVGNLGSFLEEELGKVSLVGLLGPECGDGTAVKSETAGDEVEIGRDRLIAASNLVVPDGSVPSGVAGDEGYSGDVSLAVGSSSVHGVGSGMTNEVKGDEDENECGSGSATECSSSSTSSCSSSDDDEEEGEESDEEVKEEEVRMQLKRDVGEGDMEEGEIREVNGEGIVDESGDEEEEDGDNMVEWSDVELDDIDEEEEGNGAMRGPIRSQNELKDLPSVPRVDVALQPQHEMLPVGVVSSIISAQVIVEGVKKHNPLNEGSILWITDRRSPLGIVDEIFGPVKNPYYVVRYNSETEVPSGISQGTLISFVPEFAYHVLNEKNLYKKGYDASGENDEELSDEAEFSDDEKEAAYMRVKKMSKKGINGQTVGNKKRSRIKDKNRKNVGSSSGGQPQPNQNQKNTSSGVASMSNASSNFTGGAGIFQPVSAMAPTTGIFQPPNGVWMNGFPPQQPHNASVPGGFPATNMPGSQQNHILHPFQMPMTNGMPFQQQFNPSQGSLPSVLPLGGQMNFLAGPSPWPAVIGQNCFNQAPFGMGFQVQPTQSPMNMNVSVGNQGMMVSCGPGMEQNFNLRPGNIQAPQQFNFGAASGRGRRPFHRGGGRFAGGRGRKA